MKPRRARHPRPDRLHRATAPVTIVVVGLLALGLAGCSQSAESASFLARTPSQLLFLQWSRSGSDLSGSLLVSALPAGAAQGSPSPPATGSPSPSPAGPGVGAVAQSDQFSGTIRGRAVHLTFTRDLGMGTAWRGTLDGHQLSVTYTPKGGAPTSLVFASTTPEAYNRELLGLAPQVTPTPSFADPAAARAAIERDIRAVTSDTAALHAALARTATDVGAMQGQLASVQAAWSAAVAQRSAATAKRASTAEKCAAAAAAASDAGAAAARNNALIAATETVKSGLKGVAAASSRTATDFAALVRDRSALPSYQPKGAPTAAEVNALAASTGSTIGATQTAIAKALHQGELWTRAAQGAASTAQAACNAG